jgi:prolipoprotein diacylglyceryl transferase
MDLLASIPSPSNNVIEIGPFTIHFYGVLIALGVLVAILVAKHRYERFGGEPGVLERIAIWMVILGFLGARIAYVSTHTARFEGRPWAVFYLWEGGLALYGGLLVGTATLIFLANRWKADLFAMFDAFAVGVPLAQAIGRWGNYFNQELYGTPSDLPWAIIIDAPNRPDGYTSFETFHPTFLYESLWNALILVPTILLLERSGKLAKGASLGVYVMMYAFIRFLMELMRTDTTFRFLGLSRNGWVSIGAFLVGAAWLWWTQRRAEPRTLVGKPTLFSPQPATDGSDEDEAPAGDDAPADDDAAVAGQEGPSADAGEGDEAAGDAAPDSA